MRVCVWVRAAEGRRRGGGPEEIEVAQAKVGASGEVLLCWPVDEASEGKTRQDEVKVMMQRGANNNDDRAGPHALETLKESVFAVNSSRHRHGFVVGRSHQLAGLT